MTWDELKTHTLAVYLTAWCPDCHRLKRHFDAKGVAYDVIDIDADADAAKRLQEKTGKQAIPFVEIDGGPMVRGWHAGEPGSWNEEIFLSEVADAL